MLVQTNSIVRPRKRFVWCYLPVDYRTQVLLLAQSVWFFVCMKYLRNRWMDLCQTHTEDVFSLSLRRVWRSRFSGTLNPTHSLTRGKKQHFSALSAIYMQFMFGKTSLASSNTALLCLVRHLIWTCVWAKQICIWVLLLKMKWCEFM